MKLQVEKKLFTYVNFINIQALREKVVMKILDLPIEQIKWLLSQFNEIENKALEMGYTEISSFLEKGELVRNLLKEKSM